MSEERNNETKAPGTAIAVQPTQALADPSRTGLAENAVAVYLAGLAEESRRTMGAALDRVTALMTGHAIPPGSSRTPGAFAASFDWAQLRFAHTSAIRARLVAEMHPSSAKKHMSAVRGVLRTAFRLGRISAEDYTRAVDLPSIQGSRLRRGRMLSPEEIWQLLEVCFRDSRQLLGLRDATMFAVGATGGPRRKEITGLLISDYDVKEGRLRTLGKRNKERFVYLPPRTRKLVDAWLSKRGPAPPDAPLFCHVLAHGTADTLKALDPQSVRLRLQLRAREAGLAHVTPHDLRRTFISGLLDAGVDLSLARILAGHENVATTTLYDRRGEAAQRDAVVKVDIPLPTQPPTKKEPPRG